MSERQTYHLGYEWLIEGPIETVFYFISHANTYPQWWPLFLSAKSDDRDVYVGASFDARVKALLPYDLHWKCTVSRLEPPHLIEVDAHVSLRNRFNLDGFVRFRLEQDGDIVRVINEQEMQPEHSLPRFLKPLGQWIFSFNHDWAMARGLAGLQRAVREVALSGVPANP